jgi:hypothetical protein
MNAQLKTVLLTILTLSVLTIAVIELTGVSSTALFNKYGISITDDNSTEARINADLKAHSDRQKMVANMLKTRISFEKDRYDFGLIHEGDTVRHTYKFINTGDNPLLISDAIPSCGCTVPSFSKKPVAPGAEGEIQVEFHSANRKGKQHKNIIIVSNAERDRVSIGFDADVQ